MTALTIKQPWGELIILGVKDVENRSRRTNFRGRFAVHVSLKPAPPDAVTSDVIPPGMQKPVQQAWERNADAGRVIGTVELVDCLPDSGSLWAIEGYWHWVLRDPRPYARPIRARGQLGFWNWVR